MISKIPTLKYIDLMIWFLILILFIYDGFVSKISNKIVWIVVSVLLFISLLIKFRCWAKQ